MLYEIELNSNQDFQSFIKDNRIELYKFNNYTNELVVPSEKIKKRNLISYLVKSINSLIEIYPDLSKNIVILHKSIDLDTIEIGLLGHPNFKPKM